MTSFFDQVYGYRIFGYNLSTVQIKNNWGWKPLKS